MLSLCRSILNDRPIEDHISRPKCWAGGPLERQVHASAARAPANSANTQSATTRTELIRVRTMVGR